MIGVLLWLRRHFTLVRVVGESMMPSFRHGEELLVHRTPPHRIRTGDVVVFHSAISLPTQETAAFGDQHIVVPVWLLKRVVALPGDDIPPLKVKLEESVVPAGSVIVFGDNAEVSSDSRQFGFYPLYEIHGRVMCRFRAKRSGVSS
ncbi:S26 family signal peptidase [Streptosporangium sp. NPDC023615]|uniref:S26 family signal peptidase n=1 Tax=Streptosporangium sp. NPDC023615 TaxID=3154794 RepID=UPI00343AC386